MINQLLFVFITSYVTESVLGIRIENASEPIDYKSGVFHSLDEVFNVFNMPQYRNISEVKSLLDMFDKQCQFQSGKKYMRNRHRNVFVVIEGTPGSGSRYFSMKLMKSLGGTYIMSPPNCFAVFRLFFDTQDFLLRSAFYALGNYIVAELVKRNYFFKPVVVNRYWQSHASMSLTKEAMQGRPLPPRDSPLYRWPRDLLVPDIIFFLTKAQIVHNPIVAGSRGAMNKHFVDLMVESYIRMRDPPVIDVDGGAFKTKTYTTLVTLTNLTQQHLRDTYDAMGYYRPADKVVAAAAA